MSKIRRPKNQKTSRQLDEASMIDAFFLDIIKVPVDDQLRPMTNLEAILRQVCAQEVAGNGKAAKARLAYQRLAARQAIPMLTLVFIESEYTQTVAGKPKKLGGSDVR